MSEPLVIRRVVTGQRGGEAFVTSDDAPPHRAMLPNGIHVTDIWATARAPVSLDASDAEPTDGAMRLQPAPGGSTFRVAEFPGVSEARSGEHVSRALYDQLGSQDAYLKYQQGRGAVHRTDTLDYCIVIEGRITLILDERELILNAGDIVVQRGSNHIWRNHTEKRCLMAFVMFDAVRELE